MHTPESAGADSPLVLSVVVAPDATLKLAETIADLVGRRFTDQTHTDQDAPLLDAKGVAERLSISVRTLDTLISGGEIVPTYVGRQRRFTPGSVNAYLRRKTGRHGGGSHR